MHNLIYLSSASYLYSNDELAAILNKSRLNNTRLGVTGLLLYNEGNILQILEGEENVLRTLYDKISRDVRHKGMIKVIDASIRERSFGDWSMGFKQTSNEDWSKLKGYVPMNSKETLQMLVTSASIPIVTMVKSFADVNRNILNSVNY